MSPTYYISDSGLNLFMLPRYHFCFHFILIAILAIKLTKILNFLLIKIFVFFLCWPPCPLILNNIFVRRELSQWLMLKLDARSIECFSVSRREVAQTGTFIKMFSIYKRFFNVDSLCLRGFNPYLNEDCYLITTVK